MWMLNSSRTTIFNYNNTQVRVIERDGEPWFVAKDVAEVLGYSRPADAVTQHCRGSVKHRLIDSLGRMQNTTIIPERDVYRLIMRSKLPSAERFEEWVVGEVLPAIRKTGVRRYAGYIPVEQGMSDQELCG